MLWWWKYRLGSKDPTVRENAAARLAQSSNPRAIPILSSALSDPVTKVRLKAMEGLWQWNDPQVVPSLVAALRDSEKVICKMAVAGLREIGWKGQRPTDQLLFALATDDWSEFFVQISDERVAESLLEQLACETLPKDAEQKLSKAASLAGKPGILFVKAALQRKQPTWCRECAASALARMDCPETLPLLAEAIRISDIRREAARALGRFGDRAGPFLAPYAVDEDAAVRQAVAESLGNVGGLMAIEILVRQISDKQDAVRKAVVNALGRIGGSQAIEILARSMNEADSSLRQAIADQLGRIGGQDAVDVLEANAEDEDDAVRKKVLAALRPHQSLIRSPLIRARLAIEEKAWDRLVQMSKEAIGPLQSYFDSGGADPNAVDALEKIGGPLAPDMLVALLTRGDFFWKGTVAHAAGRALVRMQKRAIEALFTALESSNESIRYYSGHLLGEIGDRSALSRMISMMADERALEMVDPNWKTSKEARQAVPKLAALAAEKGGRYALEAGWRLVYIGRATQTAEPFIAALQCNEYDYNSECSPRGIAIRDMSDLRDPQAFGPLLELISYEHYAATILNTLVEILKCSAVQVEFALLETAASQSDVEHAVHIGDTYIPDTSTTGWTRSDYENRTLDCSSLRKLARIELNRRNA